MINPQPTIPPTVRFDEIKLLKSGWLDGEGEALDPAALDELSRLFTAYYPSELPQPFVFPTLTGGVSLEWWGKDNNPTVHIYLPGFEGFWSCGHHGTVLNLRLAEDWACLIDLLKKL